MLHLGEGVFVAYENLGLHPADAGEGCELLQQVAEQVAAALAFENLIDRLERHVLIQLLLVAGVADAADLRAAHYRQQVEFVKRAGGFCKSKAQTLAQKPLRQIHLEDGRQAEGYAPGEEAHRHRNGYRARGLRTRQVGECAAAFIVAVKQSRLSGVGPDFYHRDPPASVRQALGAANLLLEASAQARARRAVW